MESQFWLAHLITKLDQQMRLSKWIRQAMQSVAADQLFANSKMRWIK